MTSLGVNSTTLPWRYFLNEATTSIIPQRGLLIIENEILIQLEIRITEFDIQNIR